MMAKGNSFLFIVCRDVAATNVASKTVPVSCSFVNAFYSTGSL
jgi:hypothetical protein